MQLPLRVALNIKQRRKQLGLTQVQLAKKITELAGREWAQPQVSDLERGRFSPMLPTLELIAQALDMQPARLLELPAAKG